MDRWTGVLKVSLYPSNAAPFFTVAASLLLAPSSKTLAVPSVNAIFFNGDRVEGTGNPVIERLSNPKYIAELIVSKLGGAANAWVVEASTFNGPFAVYKEFLPSVNSFGEPRRYDPGGFPASSATATILSKCIEEVKNVLSCKEKQITANENCPRPSAHSPLPKTVILGFSKGGVVVNQILTELGQVKPNSILDVTETRKSLLETFHDGNCYKCPTSKDELLLSISEFHYVDVGLNTSGAYLTDKNVIKNVVDVVEHCLLGNSSIRFVLHGTPRQWSDSRRPWIQREKNTLLHLLKDEASTSEAKLHVTERWYFKNLPPSMQMHFEIIENLDMS